MFALTPSSTANKTEKGLELKTLEKVRFTYKENETPTASSSTLASHKKSSKKSQECKDQKTIVPVESRIKGVFLGSYSSLLLTTDNEVWMGGQLSQQGGDDQAVSQTLFKKIEFDPPIYSPITSISLGYSHQILLVKDENRVYLCGSSGNGRLGVDHDLNKFTLMDQSQFNPDNLPVTHAKCAGIHSMIVLDNRLLYMAGWGGYSQHAQNTTSDIKVFSLANPNFAPNERIRFVSGGSAHTIVVTEANLVYGCGCNEEQMLGVGQTSTNMVPTLTLLNFHETFGSRSITQVECGYRTTVFVLDTNEVYFIGHSHNSESGLGGDSYSQLTKLSFPGLESARELVVSCGLYNTLICINHSDVYLAGKFGDLQCKTFTHLELPVVIPNLKAACAFSSMVFFSDANNSYSKSISRFFSCLRKCSADCMFDDIEIIALH